MPRGASHLKAPRVVGNLDEVTLAGVPHLIHGISPSAVGIEHEDFFVSPAEINGFICNQRMSAIAGIEVFRDADQSQIATTLPIVELIEGVCTVAIEMLGVGR